MPHEIEALGYIGLEVASIADWRHFAEHLLGLSAHPRDDGTIDLRMDNYASRIRLHEGPRDDLAYSAWEVRDAAALQSLSGRLEAGGVAVEWGSKDVASDRRVHDLIIFSDPEGGRIEAFYGPLQRTDLLASGPYGTRFKTGRQGLGHIVISCRDKPAMMAFYETLLGFRVSDHIHTEVVPGKPLELTFMRCNARHHSLALAPVPLRKRLVHLMVEVTDLDDVGRAMHRCLDADVHLSMTLGRHSNDEMLSFYPLSPSGFDIEYGWGGLSVDDESWHVLTHDRTSAWGHVFQRPPRPALREESRT